MNELGKRACKFSSVQSLSRVRLFATLWITARQASLSITNSRSSPRLTSIESVMPSSHLILCHPLLLLPPIPPSIRVFSNVSTLRMRWPKYWSFSFSIIANLHSLKKTNIQIGRDRSCMWHLSILLCSGSLWESEAFITSLEGDKLRKIVFWWDSELKCNPS